MCNIENVEKPLKKRQSYDLNVKSLQKFSRNKKCSLIEEQDWLKNGKSWSDGDRDLKGEKKMK